jgi:hypothetical protein
VENHFFILRANIRVYIHRLLAKNQARVFLTLYLNHKHRVITVSVKKNKLSIFLIFTLLSSLVHSLTHHHIHTYFRKCKWKVFPAHKQHNTIFISFHVCTFNGNKQKQTSDMSGEKIIKNRRKFFVSRLTFREYLISLLIYIYYDDRSKLVILWAAAASSNDIACAFLSQYIKHIFECSPDIRVPEFLFF